MSRKLLLSAASALAVVTGAWLFAGYMSSDLATIAQPAAAQEASVSTSSDMALAPDMILGAADAPLTVTEYASFTCPHCAAFHRDVWGEFKKNYIETGKVRFVYREVYFDKYGLWAALVARCGGPEKYFGISDMLYDDQREWLASGDAQGISDALRKIGISAGMTGDQVEACLKDDAKIKAMVETFQTNTAADKIESTPSFVIEGEVHSGEMPYAEFAAIIDKALAN